MQRRLQSQLPSEWGVRVLPDPRRTGRLEVMFHHRKKARIAVRSVGDCEFKVAARSPALGRAARRILHPIDVDDDVPLDLDRCLDRVVVKAHQYVNTGQFFDA